MVRAVQKDEEDEEVFEECVRKAARLCRHVFKKIEVVNRYIQGIKPSVREYIGEYVRLMMEAEKRSLAVVRQAAVSQGKVKRLMLEEVQAVKPKSKAADDKSGPKTVEKLAWKSSLLQTTILTCVEAEIGYKTEIVVKNDEEAHQIAMELEPVLFVGGQVPDDK